MSKEKKCTAENMRSAEGFNFPAYLYHVAALFCVSVFSCKFIMSMHCYLALCLSTPLKGKRSVVLVQLMN